MSWTLLTFLEKILRITRISWPERLQKSECRDSALAFFDMSLDSVEGLVTDVVFDTAGIFGSGLFIDTYVYEQLCEHGMALVDAFGQYLTGFCQRYKSIIIFFNEPFVFEYAQCAAYGGL